MTYDMYDLMGGSDDEPDEARIREILGELEYATEEHTDVSLGHESGWSLSVFSDWAVLWKHVDVPNETEQWAALGSEEEVVRVLLILARGEIETVQQIIDAAPQPDA